MKLEVQELNQPTYTVDFTKPGANIEELMAIPGVVLRGNLIVLLLLLINWLRITPPPLSVAINNNRFEVNVAQ